MQVNYVDNQHNYVGKNFIEHVNIRDNCLRATYLCLTCNIIKLHIKFVNIIMLNIDMNKSHVDIIIMHVNMIYLACRIRSMLSFMSPPIHISKSVFNEKMEAFTTFLCNGVCITEVVSFN